MTFIKKMMGLCGLTAALALASGCSDYTYFNVFVYLNGQAGDNMVDNPILEKMDSCTISVFKGNLEIGDLSRENQVEKPIDLTEKNGITPICRLGFNGTADHSVEGKPIRKIGVLDYSTARKSGDLTFAVTVTKEGQSATIAQGVASKGMNAGKVEDVELFVNACKTDDHQKGQDCKKIQDIN
jgi:hypothetical protein